MNLPKRGIAAVLAMLAFLGFFGCGSGSESSNAPQGAWKSQQTVTNRYAPPGFGAIMAWAQAATISKSQTGPATVEVDYMRLVEVDPSTGTTVLSEMHYDTPMSILPMSQGALYDRSPTWFGNDDHHVPMTSSSIANSILTIQVGEIPDSIPHWWTERKPCKPTATYYVEVRAKISGKVALQVGGDFWTTLTSSWAGDNVNNREYFASDWYGDTNGQFVVFRAPRF